MSNLLLEIMDALCATDYFFPRGNQQHCEPLVLEPGHCMTSSLEIHIKTLSITEYIYNRYR